MSLLFPRPNPAYQVGYDHGALCKTASDAVASPVLTGRFYVSKSGWGLLSVPNDMVRGMFEAMQEPGIELPPGHGNPPGPFNAHISVIRKEEIAALGGPDKIKERGEVFRYQLGPIKSVVPLGWDEMSKCWFVEVNSTELKNLRKSYGLPPLPVRGDKELAFHISIAVRRKGVLHNNELSKAALSLDDLRTAAADVDPEPTEAQKASGNYKKGHVNWNGLPLTIETARGQYRRGTAKDGTKWSIKMQDHYGYIKKTESEADGDHLDVFLCEDHLDSEIVFIVNQFVDGKFDEHKIMLGCIDEEGARAAYLRNYDKDWKGLKSVRSMTLEDFKKWIVDGDTAKAAAELPKATLKPQRQQFDPVCPHCGEVMYEKHFVPNYNHDTQELEPGYRHRGPCYDKGPFEIDWPSEEAEKAACGDMLAFKAWKATGLSDEEADRKAGESLALPGDEHPTPQYKSCPECKGEMTSKNKQGDTMRGAIRCTACDHEMSAIGWTKEAGVPNDGDGGYTVAKGERCQHCGALFERGDDGDCNSCGKKYDKEAGVAGTAWASTPIAYNSQLGPMGNILQHLRTVGGKTQSLLDQNQNLETFKSQSDPNYQMTRTLLALKHGPQRPAPVDQAVAALANLPMAKLAATISRLKTIKSHSDKKQYAHKQHLLRKEMQEKPEDWQVDRSGQMAGVEHSPTGFRFHLPHAAVPR